jgi:phosphatidylserine/phosphatidylglycerophosphate/cardiolipin synthase-like enzyme
VNRIFSNNTNPNRKNDYFGLELEKYSKTTNVFVAAAFFTDSRFIRILVDNGSNVQLIIRLGFPTRAQDLKNIFNYKNKVDVRYFTSSKFHPKLYIFGNKIAFVGSSNLTDAGLIRNQELNVAIDSEDPAFDEFARHFSEILG